jgi:hypothetical protein
MAHASAIGRNGHFSLRMLTLRHVSPIRFHQMGK